MRFQGSISTIVIFILSSLMFQRGSKIKVAFGFLLWFGSNWNEHQNLAKQMSVFSFFQSNVCETATLFPIPCINSLQKLSIKMQKSVILHSLEAGSVLSQFYHPRDVPAISEAAHVAATGMGWHYGPRY